MSRPSVFVEQALSLLAQSRNSEAEVLLNKALIADARDADAHHAMAVLRYQRGDKAVAEQQLHMILKQNPERVSARYDLACMLLDQGRDAEAQGLFQRVVDALPDHANAWYQLGFVLKAQGDLERAEHAFMTCLRHAPGHAAAANDLARLYRDRGDYAAALAVFERSESASSAAASYYQSWWQFLSMSSLPGRALQVVQRAVREVPMDAELRLSLAQSLEGEGDSAGAEREYRLALRLDGNRGFAIGNLLSLLAGEAETELVRRAEMLLQDPSVRPAARALIGFGLGKVYHAKADSAAAFRCWQIANVARRSEVGSLDRDKLDALISQTLSSFTAASIRRLSSRSSAEDRPTLIVGMPRSGTTLVEQILASHSMAEGLGELPDLPIVAENYCKALGSSGQWPSCDDISDESVLLRCADHYRRVLEFRASSARSSRLIDKSPLNFFNLGLFSLMFPSARIIWCRRDPRDVCLSIFSENFAHNQKYSTDLADLALYYRRHEQLMMAWKERLPNPIHEVSYKSLVQDQDTQTRRLIEFVGLPWEEACLQFHRSERSVQTPSRWQVRQPMYTSSLSRWRRYAPWLGPLLKEFGEEETPRPLQL